LERIYRAGKLIARLELTQGLFLMMFDVKSQLLTVCGSLGTIGQSMQIKILHKVKKLLTISTFSKLSNYN